MMLLRTALALLCPLVTAGKQGESLLNPAKTAIHVVSHTESGNTQLYCVW